MTYRGEELSGDINNMKICFFRMFKSLDFFSKLRIIVFELRRIN